MAHENVHPSPAAVTLQALDWPHRSLDLKDIQFNEPLGDFLDLDPLLHNERMHVLDKDTQDFVLRLRQLTGYGPQVRWRGV